MNASGRYMLLAAGVIVVGAGLASIARRPQHIPAPTRTAPASVRIATTVTITASGINEARVPSGSDVTLTLVNHRDTEVAVQLAGYSDRLGTQHVPAHGSTQMHFHADRPGEDFAWMQDGQPIGRFIVTGSHLEKGHQ